MSQAIAGPSGMVVVEDGRSRARAARRWGTALLMAMLAAGQAAPAAAAKGAGQSSKDGATTSSAKDDARAQAKAAVARAQIDYKLRNFQAALDGYRRAYELFQAPVLLFNIGQCHRNLGDPEKAIFFFEGYLREETRPEPERRKLVDELIAELRPEAQRQRAVAAAQALAAARAAAPPPRPRVRLTPTNDPSISATVLPQAPPAAPEKHRSITSRWWFWTAIGGACALAAGAAVYYATGEPRLVPASPSIGTYTPPPPAASP